MYSLILIHIHLRILFIWMAIRRRSLRIGCPRIIPRTKGIRILIANPPLPRASDKRYSSCLYWWIVSMPQAMAKRVRAMKAPTEYHIFFFIRSLFPFQCRRAYYSAFCIDCGNWGNGKVPLADGKSRTSPAGKRLSRSSSRCAAKMD